MITVYTKDLCGYCHKAMEYLEENDFEYEEINIDIIQRLKNFLKQVGIQLVPKSTTVQAYS